MLLTHVFEFDRCMSHSRFTLDGRPSDPAAIRATCLRPFHLDPGNPCQFLAQDSVRDFPRLTPSQVLSYSVRAAGDEDTLRTLQELRAAQVTFYGFFYPDVHTWIFCRITFGTVQFYCISRPISRVCGGAVLKKILPDTPYIQTRLTRTLVSG